MGLLRIDGETTANISSIFAADPTNTVPDRSELYGEVRSLQSAKVQSHIAALSDVMVTAAHEYGGTVELKIVPCFRSIS
jgi:metal-dependent amidase/aminoacylase/carboxypeptidase family protein